MKLMGWLIGGFAIYLAATGQLMNYINLALTPSNPQTPTSGGKSSSLSGSVLNQVMPSIIGGSTGGSAGTVSAIGTGATSAGVIA
jgi:hypothetical protein